MSVAHVCRPRKDCSLPWGKSPTLREGGPELEFHPVSATCNLCGHFLSIPQPQFPLLQNIATINPELEGSEIMHAQRLYLGGHSVMATAIIIKICRGQDMGLRGSPEQAGASAYRECGPLPWTQPQPTSYPMTGGRKARGRAGSEASSPDPHSQSPLYLALWDSHGTSWCPAHPGSPPPAPWTRELLEMAYESQSNCKH